MNTMADKNYEYNPVASESPLVNQQHYRMEAGQLWRQYVIAGIVNIGILCTGFSMGWNSSAHVTLSNITTSPLDHLLTSDQESWIGSLLGLGAIFGSFFAGFTASTIGRKWGLITVCIPLLIGWILILITSNVTMIYVGRFFWGLGGGMIFTITPMYCAEIATVDTRGALGSLLQVFVTLGILLSYGIAPFASYSGTSYVGIICVSIFCVGTFFMPESPIYHLTKKNKGAATNALATIRGTSHKAVQNEIDKMEAEVTISMERTATIADVFRGSNFKAFYISCALLFFQQFSGINVVLSYLSIIFEAAGASLDSSTSTIIVGAVMVGASCITPLLVDRLGRRILFFISISGAAIGLFILGTYFILAENKNPVVASLGFLPVLALVLFIVTHSIGVGPLPWVIMADLLPIEVKTTASPMATGFCWCLVFLTTRFFNPVAESLGMGATFFLGALFCVAGFIFTFFLVPETKGKSFQEIQDMLAGRSASTSQKE